MLNLNADISAPEHDCLFLSVLINQTTNYFGAFPNGVQKSSGFFLYNEDLLVKAGLAEMIELVEV